VALRFKKGTPHRLTVDALAKLAAGAEPTYAVIEKSRDELRYTFGPLYSPDVPDAHDEYARAEDLQKALWDYFLNVDKGLRKQHGDEVIGKIVELVQWPFTLDAELAVAGEVKKFHLPAGTVYAGVHWSEEAWPQVKSGEITGLSMGGRAVRVAEPEAGLIDR
jgi:hypothetical protein